MFSQRLDVYKSKEVNISVLIKQFGISQRGWRLVLAQVPLTGIPCPRPAAAPAINSCGQYTFGLRSVLFENNDGFKLQPYRYCKCKSLWLFLVDVKTVRRIWI